MVNYSLFIGRAAGLMYRPSVIKSPSSRVPEKAPRWDLTGAEACGGGKVFWWMLLMLGEYLRICRGGIRVRGLQRGPQALWACLRGAPPGLWAAQDSSNPNLLLINSEIFPNDQKCPPKYFSAAVTFCTREIPSWDLFRCCWRGIQARRASTSNLLPFR